MRRLKGQSHIPQHYLTMRDDKMQEIQIPFSRSFFFSVDSTIRGMEIFKIS